MANLEPHTNIKTHNSGSKHFSSHIYNQAANQATIVISGSVLSEDRVTVLTGNKTLDI